MTSKNNSASDNSFLSEAQTFGKASGKVDIGNLDEVLAHLTKISDDEALAFYKNEPEEKWQGKKIAIYCHDCRLLVPPEIKTIRGKMRKVCGTCGSVKISAGSAQGLKDFYHIEESKDSEKK